MTSILWQIPIATLVSVVAMRLLLSPFMVHRKRDKEAKLAEIARDKAETNLDQLRQMLASRATEFIQAKKAAG